MHGIIGRSYEYDTTKTRRQVKCPHTWQSQLPYSASGMSSTRLEDRWAEPLPRQPAYFAASTAPHYAPCRLRRFCYYYKRKGRRSDRPEARTEILPAPLGLYRRAQGDSIQAAHANPPRVCSGKAVWGMLPKNSIGRKSIKRLRVMPATPTNRPLRSLNPMRFNRKGWQIQWQLIIQAQSPISTGPEEEKSVARVRILPGSGSITINGRDIDDYFGLETLKLIVNQPFGVTGTVGKFDVLARVTGGGIWGRPALSDTESHGHSRWLTRITGRCSSRQAFSPATRA